MKKYSSMKYMISCLQAPVTPYLKTYWLSHVGTCMHSCAINIIFVHCTLLLYIELNASVDSTCVFFDTVIHVRVNIIHSTTDLCHWSDHSSSERSLVTGEIARHQRVIVRHERLITRHQSDRSSSEWSLVYRSDRSFIGVILRHRSDRSSSAWSDHPSSSSNRFSYKCDRSSCQGIFIYKVYTLIVLI